MKKHILLGTALASLFMLGACDYNEDNFPGYDEYDTITDIRMDTIALIDANYASIAKLTANKELALSKDPEGETYVKALEQLGKDKFFTDLILPEEFLPAYLADLYPYLSDNSKILVNYRQAKNLPEYLADFNGTTTYEFTEADYKTVWGDKAKATFLSPSTVKQVSTILKSANPDAKKGAMVLASYAYSETEPSTGGGSGETTEPTWTPVASIPVRAVGTNWDFVNMGLVDLSEYKGQTVHIGFKYTSTTEKAATWELKNFKALSVPYADVYLFAKQEDGSFKKVAKKSGFIGAGEYVIVSLGADKNYYPFGRLADGKTYGYMYPDPINVNAGVISATDAADFIINIEASSVEGKFNLKNAIGQYFYMSGTYDSFNVAETIGESGYDWTIASAGGADLFSITNGETGKSVKLNYYVNKDGEASYSFGSYAASKVEGYTYVENSLLGDNGGFTIYDVNTDGLDYIWQNSADYGFKASAFVNKVNHAVESYLVSPAIDIAENAVLPYFTIDEALNFGTAEMVTVYVSTDYIAPETKTRATTRAYVKPNRTAAYFFDGEAWSEYSVDDVNLAVVQPAEYDEMGVSSISKPDEMLPIYLSKNFAYAQASDVVAVVYKSGDNAISATEYTFDGSAWIKTVNSIPASMMFMRTNDKWVEAVEYYSNSFAGELHGDVQIVDIELDGKDYVWSALATSEYIQASGYYQRNRVTESWLVTPVIDMTEAIAPKMVFEASVNYLYNYTLKDYIKVNVSTDYVPNAEDGKSAVQAANWTELEFANWPSDLTFVEMQTDMSAYKGKKVYVAFKFASTADCAPTFRLKNFAVKE